MAGLEVSTHKTRTERIDGTPRFDRVWVDPSPTCLVEVCVVKVGFFQLSASNAGGRNYLKIVLVSCSILGFRTPGIEKAIRYHTQSIFAAAGPTSHLTPIFAQWEHLGFSTT